MDPSKLQKMRPSVRNKQIGQASHQSPKSLLQAAGALQPEDLGSYLVHSLDLSAIIPALSHDSPKVRTLAINALHKAWLQKPPTETIQAVGGAVGLANILNSTLPFRDAKNLASKLGHDYRGPKDPRTSTLDALVALMIPSIGNEESATNPIMRLASTLATSFLPAVSPQTVASLVKLVGPNDHHRLQRLAHTQPECAAELLSTELTKIENSSINFSPTTINSLFALKKIRGGTSDGHWGINLYLRLTSSPLSPALKYKPSIPEAIRYGRIALRNATSDAQWNQVLESLLKRAEAEKAIGNTLGISGWKPLILDITKALYPSKTDSMVQYLVRIGKVKQPNYNYDNEVQRLLPAVTPGVRPILLRSLHDRRDNEEWTFPYDITRVSVATIMQFNKEHGESLMKQVELHLNNYSAFSENGHQTSSWMGKINGELAAQQTDRDDAVSTAVHGRWAFAEGELTEQEKAKQAIDRWKKLVHRQRVVDARSKYINTLLTMVAIIGDVQLLKDTFAWTFERFLKDVDIRPTVFLTYMQQCTSILAGDAKNLEESAYVGDEILDLYVETMSKARTEPGFVSSEFTSAYTQIASVLVERLRLCQRHSISLERTRAVVSPLEALCLRVEEIVLDDPGTFGEALPYPTLYSSGWGSYNLNDSTLLAPYRRVLVNFMDNLGRARDAVYAERRTSINSTERTLLWHERLYPWSFSFNSDLFEDLSIEKDAPFLMEYLTKVIYTPLDKDTRDEKFASNNQWSEALDLLAKTLRYSGSRDRLLSPIIQHYRNKAVTHDGKRVDLSGHLLTVHAFMDAVNNSEILTETFFAPYISNETEFNRQAFVFGSPPYDDKKYETEPNFDLLRRRQTHFATRNMLMGAIPRRTRSSQLLRRRFALMGALFWVASIQGKEPADKDYSLLSMDTSTLDFASLYSNADFPNEIGQDMSFASGVGIKTLSTAIDQLSLDEMRNLIDTIKTLLTRKENQPHRDEALRVLAMKIIARSRVPILMEEDIFEVLSDTKRSTIHRHFFTGAILGRVSPENSKRLTRRFVKQIQDALKSQPIEVKQPESTVKEGEGETKEPPVKISTIKYLVETVCRPITGFTLRDMADELVQLTQGDIHPSLQQVLLANLTSILVREGKIQSRSQMETIWQLLEQLALVAVSLNEWRLLREKDWKANKLPKVVIENPRPVEITNINVMSLEEESRSRWASTVDGMYGQQVQSTHRWFTEFLRRHNATEEDLKVLQDAEIGPMLSSLQNASHSSYKSLRKYLPEDSWHLRILTRQIVAYITVHKLHVISGQFSTSDPEWYKAEDGKDFLSLLTNWSQQSIASFGTLISIYQEHDVPEIDRALRWALDMLLQPYSMVVTAGNARSRSIPWGELSKFTLHFKPNRRMSKEMEDGWKNRIRPLLQWFSERVQRASVEDGQPSIYYDPLKRQIKLLLLPFPFLKLREDAEDADYDFAIELLKISTELLEQPSALLSISHFLTTQLNVIINLVDDRFAVARHLINEAEKLSNENERLLACRLAQFFNDNNSGPSLTQEQHSQWSSIIASLENHSDDNVRLMALSVPRSVVDPSEVTRHTRTQQ